MKWVWLCVITGLLAGSAFAQSVPLAQSGYSRGQPWPEGYIPTARETQDAFAAKQDILSNVKLVSRGDGAVCDGATDDTLAIQADISAVSSTGGTVVLPNATCYSATGVTVPPGVTLTSYGWNPSNPAAGAQIQCAQSVMACVTLTAGTSGTTTVGGITLRDIVVSRTPGLPPAGSVGVMVRDAYNVHLNRVLSTNHAIGFQAQNDGSYGITLTADSIQTSAITDAHFVDNSWPEVKISHARFGTNGTIDPYANAFIRLTGGFQGPNTVTVSDSQFNLGSGNEVGTFLDLKNLDAAGQGNIISEFTFIGNHVEDVLHFVQTDSTVTTLARLTMIGNTFLDNQGACNFWNLANTTSITDSRLIGNDIGCRNFTLPGYQPVLHLLVDGNNFNPSIVSVIGSSEGASNLDFISNSYSAGLSISGAFSQAHFSGVMDGPGSFSNTSIGFVAIDIPGQISNCSLGLTLGGGSTGMTFSQNRCHWQMHGDIVTVNYDLELSAVGTSTGNLMLTGLPLNSSPISAWGGGAIGYYANTAAVVGGLTVSPVSGTMKANIFQSSASGSGQVTQGNLTNTTKLIGTFNYSVAP